jgi:hypothetical protein
MTRTERSALLGFVLFAAAGLLMAQGAPYADCHSVAAGIAKVTTRWSDRQAAALKATTSLQNVIEHAPCFATFLGGVPIDAKLVRFYLAASNHQQQSSPSGSSSATSPVSKPSGSNSVIQDIGGLTASNSGSSFTVQVAPGDLFSDLASAGLIQYCTASLHLSNCVSRSFLGLASRTTLSATVNTSTSGQQVTGAASSSTGSTAAGTVSSTGDSRPTFGGVSAKYVAIYTHQNKSSKDDGGVSSASMTPSTASELAISAGISVEALGKCDAYKKWLGPGNQISAADAGEDAQHVAKIYGLIQTQYRALAKNMSKDATCADAIKQILGVVKNVSSYQAALARDVYLNAATPLLGFEYDFTTPVNKPNYHSAKANFSWQSPVSSCEQAVTTTTRNAKISASSTPTASTVSGKKCDSTTSNRDGSTAPSPTWTINASAGADIYAGQPSSSVSVTLLRDVQAGAEIDYVIASSTWGSSHPVLQQIFSSIGDTTIAGAYYYQDQTSPSFLNGPPSTITFDGLPSGATQIYTERGPINLGQVRLGFGTGKSARFPLAFTYSNRSELIVHPTWGVQFGISYDLSSLLSSGSSSK